MKNITISTLAFFLLLARGHAANQPPNGWQSIALREEIRPRFSYEPHGGPDLKGAFVIGANSRE